MTKTITEGAFCYLDFQGDWSLRKEEAVVMVREQLAIGKLNFVLDFTNLEYIDSGMLSLLIWLIQEVKPLGGSMKVVAPDKKTKKLFQIISLDHVIPVFSTKEEALSA